MDWSLAFKEAHARAKEDVAYNPSLPEIMRKSYAYYFRLQLINFIANERNKTAALVPGFVVYGRDRWA